MKVRKAIKKLVAIGTGAVMMGATIVGAMAAADLSDYPSPFIKNGEFDGLIVVGEDAASSDVVGAIDIAISLQYGAKTTSTVSTGGSVGSTTVTGDAATFVGGADMLEMNENLGDVKETFTETDLSALAGGLITTDAGTTDYNQYLRFKNEAGTAFPGKVIFSENEDEEVGDFLYFQDGTTIFEYELQFEEGLESDVVTADLQDIENEALVILGKKFNVVNSDVDMVTQEVKMTLLGGEVTDTLMEGETKTYTIDGMDYEVKLLIVADTNNEAKFVVNGEVTDKLVEGSTDTLSDGTLMGIRDVMPNEGTEEEGGDIVEFYLGASKLELKDTEYNASSSSDWYSSGVEVNDESIEDMDIIIDASEISQTDNDNGKLEINTIKLRLKADSPQGDVFVKEGQGVRELLDEPEGMINPLWDIEYKGLTSPATTEVAIKSNGDNSYDLYFTNMEGLDYKVPLVDNSNNDDHGFKLGDNDDDLHFIEAPALNLDYNNNGYWISEDDYFLLGDASDEDGVYSHVLRYESIDSSNREISFTDLAGGQKEVTYDSSSLQGNLIVGGKTYQVKVNTSDSAFPLWIDLSHNSAAGGTAKIAIEGGMIVDLSGNGNITATDINAALDANNKAGSAALTSMNLGVALDAGIMVQTVIDTDKFDESSSAVTERVNITVTSETNDKVDLAVSGVSMRTLDDEDLQKGMTNFGVLYVKSDTTSSTDAEDLTITMPAKQLGGQVFVTFGDTKSTSSSAGEGGAIEVTNVERINVGAAKLDKEITNVWAQNLIVVGGPCANKVAKEVMGVTAENCAAGFEEGKAVVKLFEKSGKVALLVAGYSAMDTRRAARVVSDFDKYADDMTGAEVVVSGTTLTDITVSQPTPKVEMVEETEEAEE